MKKSCQELFSFFLDFVNALSRPRSQRTIIQTNDNFLTVWMTPENFALKPRGRYVLANFDAVPFFELADHVGSLPLDMYILYHKKREPSTFLLQVLGIIEEIPSTTKSKP